LVVPSGCRRDAAKEEAGRENKAAQANVGLINSRTQMATHVHKNEIVSESIVWSFLACLAKTSTCFVGIIR